jgi:hypothetical protein
MGPGVAWVWLDSVSDEPRHVSRLLAYTHSPILVIDASMGEGKGQSIITDQTQKYMKL